MSEELNEGIKLGIEIAKLRQKIIELPLDELLQKTNHWETITPLIDPSLFIKESKRVSEFKAIVRILARAKNQFLQIGSN
ncbi:MAG: hypothetical protein V3V00_16145 [Saprospiraceae bacterium]